MKKNNKTKSQIMLELSDFQPIKAFGVNEYSYDILCEYQGNEQAVLSLCDSKKRIIIRFSHPEQISKKQYKIEQKKFKNEYDILEKLHMKYKGKVDFDYYQGRKALAKEYITIDSIGKRQVLTYTDGEYHSVLLLRFLNFNAPNIENSIWENEESAESFLGDFVANEMTIDMLYPGSNQDILIVQLISEIHQALMRLHQAKICHLNLSLDNVLVCQDYAGSQFSAIPKKLKVILQDYTCAQKIKRQGVTNKSYNKSIKPYEMLMDRAGILGKPLSPLSDLYAFKVNILLALLSLADIRYEPRDNPFSPYCRIYNRIKLRRKMLLFENKLAFDEQWYEYLISTNKNPEIVINRITALLNCYADYITQATEDIDLENEPKAIKNKIEKECSRDNELFLQSNINFILSKLKDINEFIDFNDSLKRPIYSEQKDGILNMLEYLSYLTVKTSFECLPEYKNLFENLEHYNDKLVSSIKALLKVGEAFNLQYFIHECQKRLFERAYDSFDQLIRMPLPKSFVENNQRYIDLLEQIGYMATHEIIFSNKSKTITGIILKILPQLDTTHLTS